MICCSKNLFYFQGSHSAVWISIIVTLASGLFYFQEISPASKIYSINIQCIFLSISSWIFSWDSIEEYPLTKARREIVIKWYLDLKYDIYKFHHSTEFELYGEDDINYGYLELFVGAWVF